MTTMMMAPSFRWLPLAGFCILIGLFMNDDCCVSGDVAAFIITPPAKDARIAGWKQNDGSLLMDDDAGHHDRGNKEEKHAAVSFQSSASLGCPMVAADSSRRHVMRLFTAHAVLFSVYHLLAVQDATAAMTMTTTTQNIHDAIQPAPSTSSPPVKMESLKLERMLGKGAYKTVYLVALVNDATASSPDSNQLEHQEKSYYALSVEPVRTKSQVKESLRGIQIAEELERRIKSENDKQFFEQIIDWWFQPWPPLVATDDANANTWALSLPPREPARTKQPPSRFLGTQWLVALKPVYHMDLKSFIQKHPILYPVARKDGSSSSSRPSPEAEPGKVFPFWPLTETVALNLLRDLCHAGRLMHAAGLVHLDIKPKNIMLRRTGMSNRSDDDQQPNEIHPVIIDFGFSRFVKQRQGNDDHDSSKNDLCFVEPARVRGEFGYVLAQDVAVYQACQKGDAYAMGKTIYELLFQEAPPRPTNTTMQLRQGRSQAEQQVVAVVSAKQSITESAAQRENDLFRNILLDTRAGTKSRFHLSANTRDFILIIIRGLCREQRPMSFDEAEHLVLLFMQQERYAFVNN
jgi:serine/threonine protein kinase